MEKSTALILVRLFSLFYQYKFRVLVIFFLLALYTLFSIALPILNAKIIDDGIVNKNFNVVLLFSFVILLIIICNAIINIVKERIRAGIASNLKQSLVVDAFTCLNLINLQYYNSRNSAEIVTNLDMDISRLCLICDSEIFMIITQLLGFTGGLIGLFIIDFRMAIIVLVCMPVNFIIVYFLAKVREKLVITLLDADHKLWKWFGETLDGIRELRLFGLCIAKRSELCKLIYDRAESDRHISIIDSYHTVSDNIISRVLELTVYIVGAFFILENSFTIGGLFAFLAYSAHVTNPLSSILGFTYMLTGMMPSAKRYFEIFDVESEQDTICKVALKDVHNISFKKVTFYYGDMCILRNINFSIKSGEKVAIIGNNGAGKSTIFNLLIRFLSNYYGEILINDISINEYDLKSYRDAFSCIWQNNYLFNMSVLNNILLYRNYAQNILSSVVFQTSINKIIDICPDSVGENGQNLSGGQRQKIILARALIRDTNCYLFDEVTSNFDNESEQILVHALQTFLKNKTLLLITHNVTLLQYMDKILQLDGRGGINEYESYNDFLNSTS